MPPAPPASVANDPVAVRTRWDPLVAGGANFRTRDLVTVNPARLEFRASLGAKSFGGVFVAMGLTAVVIGLVIPHWAPLLFGIAFGGLGGGLLYFATAPVVFDRRQDAFWRGRTTPSRTLDRLVPKHYAKLGDIHALQIISERVRGDDGSYDSYELNLVLQDGRRINVTDHGDYEALRRNADAVSRFLGRPLWDAVAES